MGRSAYQENTLVDRLDQIAKLSFIAFGIMFAIGVYIDWQMTGLVVFPPLSILEIPGGSNSGLFLLSIIVMLFGYVVSKVADKVEELQKEEFDQTQEWVVDIKGLDKNPGARSGSQD